MTSSQIKTRQENGILHISIARPEAKNAFLTSMYERGIEILRQADSAANVRVVLLSGEGGNFSAGNDLKDFVANPPRDKDAPVFRFMHALRTLSKPLIAQVEGFAVGIGTTLLLHCDLVYAADNAKFIMPFVNLALVPECGVSYALPEIAGLRKASEAIYFGEPFDAQTARELGLVNRVLPVAELADYCSARAVELAQKPPASLQASKRLLKLRYNEALGKQIDEEARVFCSLLPQNECQEALRAFVEKRKADFSKFLT